MATPLPSLTLPFRQWIRTYPDSVAAALCALLTLLGWLALGGNWIGGGVGLLLTAYGIGGYDSAREGLTTLWQEQELDVDLLMIVAALGAAALGLWQQDYYLLVDGAVLVLIFAVSGALESIALHRTAHNIRSLMQLTPDTANLLLRGQEQVVPTAKLQRGDLIRVKPGDLIPTDARVQEGHSTVNQAPITGESVPVEKSPGDEVFAGTINGTGTLTLALHKAPESSVLQRVIRLVEQAQTTAPPSQQFLDRFERGYARIIVSTGVLLAVVPPLLLGWTWETTIYRALVFLVVASPCALMAAIMPTLLSGIARGARDGILFKDGSQLERLGQVRAIAFDKTGTLTTGQLHLTHSLPTAGVSETQLLQWAASLEAASEHPIAAAIVRAAQARELSLSPVTQVQADVGCGISGVLEGQAIRMGKRDWLGTDLAPETVTTLMAASHQLEAAGQTVIWVQVEQQILGILAVADQIRPRAAELVAQLKSMGIAVTAMLTGDNPATAESVAEAVGVDRVYANLLPEDKVDVLKQLQRTYRHVAMIGDGINDAPALTQASVGIAMGGAGSDVALETADVVLMADRLEKLTEAIRIGVRSQRIIRQNIALALTSIGILLIANFTGSLTLPAGVLGHEGSTLLVTLNGLRLLRR